MTDSERIENLKSFGYTNREAEFLALAALHSGYFLRRQYCSSINRKLGKAADGFISKLRRERHIREVDLRYRRKAYSLCSKVLFEALGEPDNRNRREHDAHTIKARLMGLDYVLGRRDVRWFPTEADKVGLFSGELGIERGHLPVWSYSSKDRQRTTLRWFVDKPPIFIRPHEGTVHFCFVDPGYRTTDAFASFLRNYRSLFARLASFEVIYIASFAGAVESAGRLFDRFVSSAAKALQDPIATELLTYFHDRNEHATSGLTAFDQPRLDRYRESRKRFAGARFDHLFERWKRSGDGAIQREMSPESALDMRQRGTFSAHVPAFNFSLFGSLYEDRTRD